MKETRDDVDGAGTAETFASTSWFAYEDASGSSKAAGALAYSVMFDFPAWVRRSADSPHLHGKE